MRLVFRRETTRVTAVSGKEKGRVSTVSGTSWGLVTAGASQPERRSAYDRCVAETHQVEQAWSELSELLSQLHHKMEYAANTIRCTNCGKRHKRTIIQRPCYAARFCAQCKIHHSAREGDIWAESWMLGLLWHYYACMEGAVYDITEWAACQADNLKHLKANSHAVQYRIVLGKQNQHHHHKDSHKKLIVGDIELRNVKNCSAWFSSPLFTQGGVNAPPGIYPHHCSALTLFDQLTNPAQSVSFTAATRSVEPVSTGLLSLPERDTIHTADRQIQEGAGPTPHPNSPPEGGPSCVLLLRNLLLRSEPDLEEFLNNLYAQSGGGGVDGNTGGNENSTRQRRKGKRKK
ncbi:protein transport [Homalodisca vitripennis]|nr:protein transport [Homalodisca vitripennis]